MRLADIVGSEIPWDLLFLCLEDLDSVRMNKLRRDSLKRAAAARPQSRIAQIIDSWFPAGQERIVVPLNAPEGGVDLERQHERDDMLTKIAGAFETFGFIATPKYLDQNMVYDEENGRPVKFQQAIELISKGERKAKDDHHKVHWTYTSVPSEVVRYLTRITQEYMDLTSYDKSNKIGTGQKGIIISRNITDVATMSTGRPWTSCMNLKDGSHAKDVARAIRDGMIVAYLVMGNEEQLQQIAQDTTRPIDAIARIAIKPMRRHMSKVDITNNIPPGIGWPEDRVYHANRADISGFKESVTAWVKNKILGMMDKSQAGNYTVKGGYSDSLASFNPDNVFYDDAKIQEKLKKLLKLNYQSYYDYQPTIEAIYRQPRAEISDQVRDMAFELLLRHQKHNKLAALNSTDKSLRTNMEPTEKMTVQMLRKFPEVLPTIRNRLSPVVRDWILGHTSSAFYDYMNRLIDTTEKALTPQPPDYMKNLTAMVQQTFNHPAPAGQINGYDTQAELQKYAKVDLQTAMRTLSKIKVAIRTFVQEQGIFLPSGMLNRIRNLLDSAVAAGVNPAQVQGIIDLLPT
jgi:hypothetical protein